MSTNSVGVFSNAVNRKGMLQTFELFDNDDVQRFWKHVEDLSSGCWTWNLKTFVFQYKGMTTTPSKFSFRLAYGYWPKAKVWRLCGNKSCVNPMHLFAGTWEGFLRKTLDYVTPEKAIDERVISYIKDHVVFVSGHWMFTLASGPKWKDIFWRLYEGSGKCRLTCGKEKCVNPWHMEEDPGRIF